MGFNNKCIPLFDEIERCVLCVCVCVRRWYNVQRVQLFHLKRKDLVCCTCPFGTNKCVESKNNTRSRAES